MIQVYLHPSVIKPEQIYELEERTGRIAYPVSVNGKQVCRLFNRKEMYCIELHLESMHKERGRE